MRIASTIAILLCYLLIAPMGAGAAGGLNYPGGLTTVSPAGCVKWVPDLDLTKPGIQGPSQFQSTSVPCNTANSFEARLFANLGSPTPVNGMVYYCSDCQQTTTCAGSGTGAWARRVAGVWSCSSGGSECASSPCSLNASTTKNGLPICVDSGSGCGGGGSPAFSTITSGTNTSASMIIDSGASLGVSGTGAITATDLTCTNCIGPTEISDLALGTDTTGSYISTITASQGLAVTGGAEGATVGLIPCASGEILKNYGGTTWACARDAADLPGNCCVSSSAIGCDDGTCQACVCGFSPTCCSVGWDIGSGTCPALAKGACSASCACAAPTATPTPTKTATPTPTPTTTPFVCSAGQALDRAHPEACVPLLAGSPGPIGSMGPMGSPGPAGSNGLPGSPAPTPTAVAPNLVLAGPTSGAAQVPVYRRPWWADIVDPYGGVATPVPYLTQTVTPTPTVTAPGTVTPTPTVTSTPCTGDTWPRGNGACETFDLGTDSAGNYAGSASEGGPATTALALDADPADCPGTQVCRGTNADGSCVCITLPTQTPTPTPTPTVTAPGTVTPTPTPTVTPYACSSGYFVAVLGPNSASTCVPGSTPVPGWTPVPTATATVGLNYVLAGPTPGGATPGVANYRTLHESDFPASVSLLGQSIEGTELAATFNVPAGTTVSFGSGTAKAPLVLAQDTFTNCSAITTEGVPCWSTDSDLLGIGTGTVNQRMLPMSNYGPTETPMATPTYGGATPTALPTNTAFATTRPSPTMTGPSATPTPVPTATAKAAIDGRPMTGTCWSEGGITVNGAQYFMTSAGVTNNANQWGPARTFDVYVGQLCARPLYDAYQGTYNITLQTNNVAGCRAASSGGIAGCSTAPATHTASSLTFTGTDSWYDNDSQCVSTWVKIPAGTTYRYAPLAYGWHNSASNHTGINATWMVCSAVPLP